MRSFTWTDPNGVTTELSDPANGLMVLAGSFGLNAPPVSNVTADLVALDGALLVKRRRPARTFGIRLNVFSSSQNVLDKIRTLTSTLQGPGTLTVSDGAIARSLLDVYYSSGLEGDYSEQSALLPIWQRFVVVFTALNPWWHGATNTVTLGFGTEIPFSDAATAFSAAVAFNGSTTTPVTVAGDTTALPAITLTGPFTTCQVGIAGGDALSLASSLPAGSTVTIDTAPGNRGPRLNNGPVDWSILTATSRLFEIPVGSSSILVSTTGTTGASAAELSYRERWLSP